MPKTLAASLLASLALLTLSGCSGQGNGDSPPSNTTPNQRLALRSFESDCEDLIGYAADGLTEEYLQQFVCFADGPCLVDLVDGNSVGPNPAEGSGGPDRVSSTNVQEAGVDEADIVKADAGGRLYVLSGTRLSVIEAFPPEQLAQREPAVLDLAANDPGFYAEDLYLDEAQKRVVVLGSRYDGVHAYATSVLIDVADPAAPRETARLGVEGYGLQSRRIDGRIHRVSRFDVPRPQWLYDATDPLEARRQAYFAARNAGQQDEAAQIKQEIRGEIGNRVENAGSAALLPHRFFQAAGLAATESQLDCGAISHPDVTLGLGVLLIDSFGADGSGRGTSGIINNAYTVYSSALNLYLVQPSAGWFNAAGQAEETAVYRFALSGSGQAEYRGLGKISGSVIGAYAFSEHEGYLRVASTETRVSGTGASTANHLSVLDARGSGEMPLVGRIENFAPGERIQGARLLGDRGFVVTFRQIDPLFALDLSDPRAPGVASELKIPGFSSYLAPIGADYLLTVGRDGSDEGLNGALAVQLFDVRELGAIRQIASLAPPVGDSGYSYSAAEYDPHAFSYFSDSADAAAPGTLTLPLTTFGSGSADNFTGFLVVRVEPGTATPLVEAGRLNHDRFVAGQTSCEGGAAGGPATEPGPLCLPSYGAAEPRRAVYMQRGEDIVLYTLSAVGLLANDARQPGVELGSLALPYDPPCCVLIEPVVTAR